MKHHRISMIAGIAMMSIISSAGAQSTSEPTAETDPEICSQGLEFTKISSSEMTVSWDTTCFNVGESNETTYTVDLFGDYNCSFGGYPCTTNPCFITNKDMKCMPPPIKPCSPVTFIVTGDENQIHLNNSNIAAPVFSTADWKLDADESDNVLSVYWGPPESSNNYASCATRANVVAICSAGRKENTTYVNAKVQGSAELPIVDCEEGWINVTVTFMSGDVLTETTSDIYNYYHNVTDSPIDPTNYEGGLSGGEIAGIVIGIFAGVVLIASVIFCYIKKKLCFSERTK